MTELPWLLPFPQTSIPKTLPDFTSQGRNLVWFCLSIPIKVTKSTVAEVTRLTDVYRRLLNPRTALGAEGKSLPSRACFVGGETLFFAYFYIYFLSYFLVLL